MEDTQAARLNALIEQQIDTPTFSEAEASAKHLADQWGPGVAAVLFYGSCLRDHSHEGKILDFYVLVDNPVETNVNRVLGSMNVLLPPNVFYRETVVNGETIRSKDAMMSLDAFARAMNGGRFGITFWARFSQPCRLLYARDGGVREKVLQALQRAVVALFQRAVPMVSGTLGSEAVIRRSLELTYGAELRSEGASAAAEQLYHRFKDHYDALFAPALKLACPAIKGPELFEQLKLLRWRASVGWVFRRLYGKLLSFLRLIKAAATFSGGIDYIAWKIERHSGVPVEVTDWQRLHPVLGGVSLFFKLRTKGAFR